MLEMAMTMAQHAKDLASRATDRLAAPVGGWLVEVSDQADAIWEPFLVDDQV